MWFLLFSSSRVAATYLYYEATSLLLGHLPSSRRFKELFSKDNNKISSDTEAPLLFHSRESGFFFLVRRELKIKMKFFAKVSCISDDICFTSFVVSRKSRRARSKKKNSVIRNRQLPSFYGARKLSKCLKVAKVKLKYQRSFLQIVYGQWRFSTYFAHFKRSFQVICKWTTVLALSFSRVPRATHHFQNEFPPRGISRMILVPLFILRVFSQEC